MPRYVRETRVNAPLDEVWAFHSNADGLRALTPDWMRLRVEAVRGPDDERNPDVLGAGSVVRLSVRPFGVGPRCSWTSRILRRERRPGAAYFRDEMVDGPFAEWVHTHEFYADGDGTHVRDEIEYELPLGPAGRFASPASRIGLERLFRDRHRRTSELLA